MTRKRPGTLGGPVIVLPRPIDAEMLRRENLTLNDYMVLMVPSEALDCSQRISELTAQVPIMRAG